MAFSRVALFTAVLVIAQRAAAQGTNATCLSQYDWVRLTVSVFPRVQRLTNFRLRRWTTRVARTLAS